MNKILILLLYYKRPTLVLNALDSIKKSTYDNWELCFIDDSGNDDFRETLFNFGLDEEKVRYIPIFDDEKTKENIGGCRIGEYMNRCIMESNCDIGIMLCDDDALTHYYLDNLNTYFTNNPKVNHCYSNVLFYHPETQDYTQSKSVTPKVGVIDIQFINQHKEPIQPSLRVDASQVAWRIKCNKIHNVWFDKVRFKDHDADFYKKLYDECGYCFPTNFIGQCKGISKNQLGFRNNKWFDTIEV